MAVLSDYVSGTISLTNGSVDFTGSGTGWLLAAFREGDTIIDITGATEFMGVIATIDANGAGRLTKPWEGPDLVDVEYRMRYQPDGARVSAQARNLIELLGNGNLQAMAGLTGTANQVIMFTGPGAMTTISKSDLISGAAYDVQVDDPAAQAAYDGQAEGFTVLISDMGDGRAAIESKVSNASGDWSEPAYVTGPFGPLPVVTVGEVTTGAPGTDVEITPTPTAEGVELNFVIPAGEGFTFVPGGYDDEYAYGKGYVIRDGGSAWITLQPTTGNAPPTLPTTNNAYWELMAQKGADGAGTGDMVGPALSVNNRVAVFDGITGKLLKDGGKTIAELVPSGYDDLLITVSLMALQLADNSNVALFLGAKGNRVADSFDALTYVDVAGATNLDTVTAGVLKPSIPGKTNTWNLAAKNSTAVLSNGNLTVVTGTTGTGGARAVEGWNSGKHYWEVVASDVSANGVFIGVVNATASLNGYPGIDANGWGYYSASGEKFNGSAGVAFASSYGNGDVVSVLLDISAGSLTFWKNGVPQGTAYTGLTGTIYPMVGDGSGTTSATMTANFGATSFVYPPPAGFNLPGNLTVRSAILTAATVPTRMKALIRVKEVDGTDAGIDYTMECSRDGGTTWSAMTLTELFTSPSPVANIRVVEAAETSVSGQPSGTSPRWRFKTLNNKNVELHDANFYWD